MDEQMRTRGATVEAGGSAAVAAGGVRTMDWLRRVRDDFAVRTAALSPEELVAYVAREAVAARAELAAADPSTARRRAPAA